MDGGGFRCDGSLLSAGLPTWATDRLRRNPAAPPPETPLVTVASDGRRMAVVAADPAALALGLRPPCRSPMPAPWSLFWR